MRFVVFASQLPSKLVDDLTHAGFEVFEALAISEVLYLCETEQIDLVIVEAGVQENRAKAIEGSCRMLRVPVDTTLSDILGHLWEVLPPGSATIQ